MKKSLFFALAIGVGIAFYACNKTQTEPTGKGILILEINVVVDEFDLYKQLKSVHAEADDFAVNIYNAADELVKSYATAAEMPDSIELDDGDYYATATYGDAAGVGFDQAYYFGQTDVFTIDAEQTTTSTVNCSVANCVVTILYSSNIQQDFTQYSTNVSCANGSLEYTENETRYGYFPLLPISIEATLEYETVGGTSQKILTGSIPAPEAGKLYQINLEASVTNGASILNILVDESLETEIINISEESEPVENNWAGALIISEIMPNPAALDDAKGEFLEFYNPGDSIIHLIGMVFSDESKNSLTFSSEITIAPGEYFTISRNDTAIAGDDYVYTSLGLTNSGESLKLTSSTGYEICSLDYSSGFPSATGASIQLSSDHLNTTDYADGSYWCVSTEIYETGDPENTGDLGTPGTTNVSCD